MFLGLLPVILSFLLLGRPLLPGGLPGTYRGLYRGTVPAVFAENPGFQRLFQGLLILASLEWLRSLYFFAAMRIAWDQPWTRLAIILGAVALFTALSGLVFSTRKLRAFYRPDVE